MEPCTRARPTELRAWLEELGLEGADVLAVLDNEHQDEFDPYQLRMLHSLLEARWGLAMKRSDCDG
jgi:hypothetical protein